jgi:hypothetical protein
MTATQPRLVGRDQPLAELQALVAAALAARGGLVTLTGEAGIGKTTLAAAAADHAEASGATVVWGAGGEGAPPLWPWREVLAALGAEVDLQADGQGGDRLRPPSAAAARFERYAAISGALLRAAGPRPLVVVLDDLHWADPASVELAAFHARRVRRSRQLLVATYRDVEVAPGDPLAGPLARLAAEGATLPLGGLDAGQVALVLAGITGGDPDPELGAGVRRRTGGNPFLVHQVARLLAAHPDAATVPGGAREAIRRRLAALGNPCVRLLEAASVLGPDLRPAVLARMTGQPAGATLRLVDEAAAARVLVGPAGELGPWRFAHDLFREVLYDQLDPAARARLHLAAAETLERLREGGADVRPAELAAHYLRAADQAGQLPPAAAARALDRCEQAALAAAAVAADEDAARHYRQALSLAERTGQPLAVERRARLLAGLGEALRRSGDTAGARQAFGQAADLARRDPAGPALARAALGLHAIGVESGADPTEVAGLLEEALAGTTPALAAQLESALAQTLARTPAPDPAQAAELAARAAAMADRAVATARATGDDRVLAAALLAKHDVLWGPDNQEERLAVLAELERLAGGDEELAAEAQLLRATALLELGEAQATALLGEFTRRARGSSLARVRWLGRSREATLAVLAGDLPQAERLAAEAERLGDEYQIPDAGHVTAGLRAGVDSLRGRPSPELLAAVERLVARIGIPVTSPRAWMTMLLRSQERPAWIDAYARAALEVAPDDVPRDWMWTRSAVILAELNADLGRDEARARWYDALAPFQARTAVAGGAVLFCGAVAHYLGLLAAATGRPELARRHLEDAAAVHERLGARPWLLRSRLELARLLRDDPAQRDRAAEPLAAVRAEADRLGLEELAADAASLLDQAGPPGGDGPAGPAEFRRAGASWTLSYAGRAVRLPDAKGMRDLAVLLSRPGQPVPAAELVALSGGGRLARAGLALGADAVLDDQAKQAYRRRLQDLDREVAEADDEGDTERIEKARQERHAIAHQLAAALGLGGRDRGLGDPAERARKAVTERIRYSLARIARAHPELARHLEASVTTGSSCAYLPAEPVTWLT